MSDEYFMDYEGTEGASTRFATRAGDLAGAAGQVLPTFSILDFGESLDTALQAASDLERAFSGRMFAYSDELSVMSRLISGVVQVTNDVDVDLTLRP